MNCIKRTPLSASCQIALQCILGSSKSLGNPSLLKSVGLTRTVSVFGRHSSAANGVSTYQASKEMLYTKNDADSTNTLKHMAVAENGAQKVRVRYAPSPTGSLHLGGLRTALYNYLFAKKHSGKCIIRIEDTDRTRFVEGAVEQLLKDLKWVGLEFDEGPGELGGKLGPYVQSERLNIYTNYAKQLVDTGHAYHCFCSAKRLEQLRESQVKAGAPSVYDRFCLHLSPEQVKEKIDRGEPNVVRMKMPHEGSTAVSDVIRGTVSFLNKTVDDQVLLKSDGYPTYHLANIVDDHLMGITHVIRGEEWLPSAVKHVVLYQMFGWTAPTFAHLPLLLREDGSKLSKRYRDASLEYYIEQGFLPEALVNFVALLGWHPTVEEALVLKGKEAASEQPVSDAKENENKEGLNEINDPLAALKASLSDIKHLKAKRVVKQMKEKHKEQKLKPIVPGAGVSIDELYSMEELQQLFQLENVQKGGSTVDFAKLMWCHNQHWKRAVASRPNEDKAEEDARLDRLMGFIMPSLQKTWARWNDGYVLHPEIPTEVVYERPSNYKKDFPSRTEIHAALKITHDHPCLIHEFPMRCFFVWVRPDITHPMIWKRLESCWIPDTDKDILSLQTPVSPVDMSSKPNKQAKKKLPSRKVLQFVLEWIESERNEPSSLTPERVVENMNRLCKENGIGLREVYLVLRICLSGTNAGAGVGEQITALGLDESEARIRRVLDLTRLSKIDQ